MRQDVEDDYWVQLDALRAIAVAGVMLHHFWFATQELALGSRGVRLFFVLSGFLITGILLNARRRVETGAQSRLFALRQFYLRRTLRIFPVFYLTLAVTWLLGVAEVRDGLFWHMGYLSNYYFATLAQWPGTTSHLWSLAVEEQFYLFWPALMLCLPRRWLLPTILGMILLGPLFRLWAVMADLNWVARFTVTAASFDSLGLGALLAYATQSRQAAVGGWRRSLAAAGLYLALPVNIALLIFDWPAGWRLWEITFGDTLWALFCVWLVSKAKQGFGGGVGALLEARPVVYLGKISYGVYVYHLFMLALVPALLSMAALGLPEPQSLASFVLLSASSVLVASLSWFCFEKPINNLKRFVSYDSCAPEASTPHPDPSPQGGRELFASALRTGTE